MIRAVVDANVIVSAFPAPDGVPGKVIEAWLHREFELITSEHILGAVEETWSSKPYFQARYDAHEIEEAVALLRHRATVVVPVDFVHGVAPNWEDDLVLATAVAGRVDYLVTGDKPFRNSVKSYHGIVLLSPREFLTLLEREDTEDEQALE